MDIPPLETFGRRIMICGPSNSGKSTLAVAVGGKLGLPVTHLDRLYHLPHTNWVPRPFDEFQRLHDEAIVDDAWVMEGNYSRLFATRIPRATGIILLGDNRWANLRRYVIRTLFQRHRPGSLDGNADRLRWMMIRYILFSSQKNVRRYRQDLPAVGLPYVEVRNLPQLNQLYSAWQLTR